MPIIIRCHSCGFILYQGNKLKSIDAVLRQWDYKCPVCLSPLIPWPLHIKVAARVTPKYLANEDEKNRGGPA
jgi:hypothetical protein